MSRYLRAFQKLAETNADDFELVGDCCMVEVIREEEFKTKGGILLSSGTKQQINGLQADKPTFVRILLVGQGTPNEEGVITPYDVNPGDICLVGATSIKPFSVFGKLVSYGETSLGLINAESIQKRFKGQDAFDRCFDTLNQAIEEQVEPSSR